MRNVEILWEVLPTRNDGSPLDIINEVASVEVSASLAGGAFNVLGNVVPNDPQSYVSVYGVGDWTFRLVVVDTDGLRSAAHDELFNVFNEPPGGVTNVVVRFDTPVVP